MTALLIFDAAITDITQKQNVTPALLKKKGTLTPPLNFNTKDNIRGMSGEIKITAPQEGRQRGKKKGRRSHSTKCGTCANGSRKRILILILHTQILLYSPTGLCYSTLGRQKAKPVSCFWPQQTLSCASPASPERKFSCDWIIPQQTAPRGRLQPGLNWDEAIGTTLAKGKPITSVNFLFCGWHLSCFRGKQKVMACAEQPGAEAVCGNFPWIWLLSDLFPWDKRFLLGWEHCRAVGICKIMCQPLCWMCKWHTGCSAPKQLFFLPAGMKGGF